jgi:hypothetical protein
MIYIHLQYQYKNRAEAEAEDTDDPNNREVLPQRVIKTKFRTGRRVFLLTRNKIRKLQKVYHILAQKWSYMAPHFIRICLGPQGLFTPRWFITLNFFKFRYTVSLNNFEILRKNLDLNSYTYIYIYIYTCVCVCVGPTLKDFEEGRDSLSYIIYLLKNK